MIAGRVALALALAARASATASDAAVLAFAGSIALPGVSDLIGATKFDHLVVDDATGTLFISAKENHTVAVVDLTTRAFVTSFAAAPASTFLPQGLELAPSLGLLLVAGGTGDNALHAFALAPPYAEVWRVPLPEDADNVLFDADAGVAWVAYGGGAVPGALAIVAVTASSGTLVANVSWAPDAEGLPSHPEEFHFTSTSRLLYGSAPDAADGGDIVVVDRATRRVVAAWPLAPATDAPFASAVDDAHARFFVCTQSTTAPSFVVLNLFDGTPVFTSPIGGGCDGLQFDAAGGLVYMSVGGGGVAPSAVYIVRQDGADAYTPLGVAPLPASLANLTLARTSAWQASTRTLLVAVPFAPDQSPPQAAQVLLWTRTAPDVGAGGGAAAAAAVTVPALVGAVVGAAVGGGALAAAAVAWRLGAWGAGRGRAEARPLLQRV